MYVYFVLLEKEHLLLSFHESLQNLSQGDIACLELAEPLTPEQYPAIVRWSGWKSVSKERFYKRHSLSERCWCFYSSQWAEVTGDTYFTFSTNPFIHPRRKNFWTRKSNCWENPINTGPSIAFLHSLLDGPYEDAYKLAGEKVLQTRSTDTWFRLDDGLHVATTPQLFTQEDNTEWLEEIEGFFFGLAKSILNNHIFFYSLVQTDSPSSAFAEPLRFHFRQVDADKSSGERAIFFVTMEFAQSEEVFFVELKLQ